MPNARNAQRKAIHHVTYAMPNARNAQRKSASEKP
jgi:hypothetical protein